MAGRHCHNWVMTTSIVIAVALLVGALLMYRSCKYKVTTAVMEAQKHIQPTSASLSINQSINEFNSDHKDL